MDNNIIDEFCAKLVGLEDEYGIYLSADYREDWERDDDNRPVLVGTEHCVVLVDKDNNWIADFKTVL